VWARKRAATDQCPRTEITAQSQGWVEAFQVWKTLGERDWDRLPAREVDALVTLEKELRAERNDEQ
jgi:hypothetical protein